MLVLPSGDDAVLLEFDSLEEVRSAFSVLDAAPISGVLDVVPAARTIMLRLDPQRRGEPVLPAGLDLAHADPGVEKPAVTITVDYTGPDLTDLADLLGLSPERLVGIHTSLEWTSAFVGFAPGFAYLVAEGSELLVPRRETSRPRVDAGSVGLAGEFTGVYPRESPGGWQLIGHTDAVLWDLASTPPSLLTPGTRVRFEARR